MTEPLRQGGPQNSQLSRAQSGSGGTNLADILERVLDKGIVIAGDIQVNLLDIELLTIKIRLLVASVDKAKEMGIDWWEHDPSLSSGSMRTDRRGEQAVEGDSTRVDQLQAENAELQERLAALEQASGNGELPQNHSASESSGSARAERSTGTAKGSTRGRKE